MIFPKLTLTFYPFGWLAEFFRRRAYDKALRDNLFLTCDDINNEFDKLYDRF